MNIYSPSRIFTLVLALSAALCSASACDPPDSPFELLADVPDSVDAALVLNNPADHILLNDSGKVARKLLAFAGIFTHTEQAWGALAKAFNANTVDTINALLSQRVVVMWDEIAPASGSVMRFAKAIDTQWVLSCEVEPAYLKEIQAQLKPVRRDIEQGHTVYAIEQGRYEIVLVNPPANQSAWATVILAPKAARSLLVDVLAQRTDNSPSIITHRTPLIDSINHAQPDWQAAWVVQLDRFVGDDGGGDGDDDSAPQSPSAFVGVLSTNPEFGLIATFATDYPINIPNADAPVGLLSAVGEDAILAVALAQTPTLTIDNSGIDYDFGVQSEPKPAENENRFDGGPGLILLTSISQGDDGQSPDSPIALTIMTGLDPELISDDSLALQTDGIIHDLFASMNPTNAPKYQGRFPSAVRTHTLDVPTSSGAKQSTAWPGNHPKFSWFASDLPSTPSLITTLGPEHADTAKQVRWIAQAARTLDAIPDHTQCKGTLTEGYFYPARATQLVNTQSALDLALLNMISRIEWEIIRTPVGIAGSTTIKLADLTSFTQLGNTK